jgi:hypothetical protein
MSYSDYTNYKNNKNACICRAGLQGPTGEKGPRGATGATGSSGETIGYYVYTTSTMTNPTDLISASTTNSFGWNQIRAAAQQNYVAWNSDKQLLSTHIYISYIDQFGVDVRNFLTMLRVNDRFVIQAKSDATMHQEWKINSINVHDSCIDFGVSNPTQINQHIINSDSVILIFSYSGVAFENLANGLEAKVTALETKIISLETTINSMLTYIQSLNR